MLRDDAHAHLGVAVEQHLHVLWPRTTHEYVTLGHAHRGDVGGCLHTIVDHLMINRV